ncbi:MAG: Gfo/Idh/MocA family oxidoreductase [Gammaproteobacteria bacterium]|nr:Gfo/Idh/MocA family oxidoreductase [Gammaproteobacteria bacterium]
MSVGEVKIGIVGLGRWAKVLTRAAAASGKLRIVAGHSRSEEKRQAYASEFGIDTVGSLDELLANPGIKGVILTVPNEQHLPVAEAVARAGKHVYTEKPIANTLENGLRIEALQDRYGIHVVVGHSARLLKGTRLIKAALESGELGRLSLIEANFSNERALELTPDTWRWYRDKAPGGPLSQLATHQFDALHYLGGEIEEVSSMAAKLSPVGAEVDDQSLTLMRFRSGAVAYVGSCWTSPGIYSIRVFGQKGLMHYELDFSTWDNPDKLHESSLLYIQRGKDGFGKRELLQIPAGNMFQDELEMFAEVCATGQPCELGARSGNVALAVVYAALRSVANNGAQVKLDDIFDEARAQVEQASAG